VNSGESFASSWAAPPEELSVSDARADVWLIPLAGLSGGGERFAEILSDDERRRAARFKFDRHRRLYVAAHGALRLILSRYLKTAPAALELVKGHNGKPALAPEFAASGLRFNLSHSHEAALVGVVRGREIGVDIEWIKEGYGYDAVARRFFTAPEVAQLRALPPTLQRMAFFKCWTSKEAFLKAKGTGLSGKLDEVKIVFGGDQQVRIHASVPGWTLSELSPGNGYEAALVVQGGALPVNCYRWQA